MLPVALGGNNLVQRQEWDFARCKWKDSGRSPRVKAILQRRWECAEKPLEGWIWPALTASGHIDHSSLKKQHQKALKTSKVRSFVLYSLRYTFLTRLGESGCDAWTLARIAGHSSVAISSRYLHPSEDAVFAAFSNLGGHNSWHSENSAALAMVPNASKMNDQQGEIWCARRDSNSRPIAPEAVQIPWAYQESSVCSGSSAAL